MPLRQSVLIHLVGPGGAGKSTVGLALATRLGIAFIDHDVHFKARAGDITVYLNANGYDAYTDRAECTCLPGGTSRPARKRRDRAVVGLHDV